ncbi:MAG TPA: hypothetical protein VEK07_23935 [Polyangiaceae bacterium]|nr:hypothetical protein [Polyangiaceae bacterium]
MDEAAVESFPASDAPAYSAMHAGAPALRSWPGDHDHEVRARLRADLERFARLRAPTGSRALLGEGGCPEREEALARAMLDADRVVVREPIEPGARVRTIESELVGAVRDAPCVIVSVRYDRDDDTRVALFLALVRALRSSRMRRSVRFVALADAPWIAGCAAYAKRLRAVGTRVHVALSLATLALARARPECLFFGGDFRLRSWTYAVSHAFEAASRIPARTVWLPDWAGWAIPDADLRDAQRLRRWGWPVVTVADRSPWELGRTASPDVDRMAATLAGLVAAVERLAGGRV